MNINTWNGADLLRQQVTSFILLLLFLTMIYTQEHVQLTVIVVVEVKRTPS